MLWPLLGAVALRTVREPAERREAAPAAQAGRDAPPAGVHSAAHNSSARNNSPSLLVALAQPSQCRRRASAQAPLAARCWLAAADLPLLPLIGMLADRLGRRPVTMLAYGLSALGMLRWRVRSICGSSGLRRPGQHREQCVWGAHRCTRRADLSQNSLLARGFGRLGMANWVAASLGSVGVGFGLAVVGATGLYLAAAGLAIVAAGLLSVAGGWHGRPWP